MSSVQFELREGVLHASDLRRRLGVSPATLMRIVRDAGHDVVRIGRGRATRYGSREAWSPVTGSRAFRSSGSRRPVRRNRRGSCSRWRHVSRCGCPPGLVFDGLPLELADARPSGFLGRHFAATHSDLRLPARLGDWSDHHILLAMSRRGEDLPGNIIVGEESFARWQTMARLPVTREDYPALARETIAGDPPGSSAGGERPKFGVRVGDRHVLVKFAARSGPADLAARRWCDLLILESVALDVVASSGVSSARTRVIESSSHWFLESERFDRVGARGRRAVLSLAALHDDLADSWARAASVLAQVGRLSDDDARRLRWLDAFGAMIGNTDRHPYNVLFFVDDGRARLAPAFDQVSMLYAPTADGQLPQRGFSVPAATSDTLDVWDEARDAARRFWVRGSEVARLSEDLRAICAANAELLAGAEAAR